MWYWVVGILSFVLGTVCARLAGIDTCKHGHCDTDRLAVAVAELKLIASQLRSGKRVVH